MLAVSVLTLIGYNYLIMGAREMHHERMMEKIKQLVADKDMVRVDASLPGIQWIEEDHEFSYHHEMYDVVKKVEENGTVYLYCLSDAKEKQLLQQHNEFNDNEKSTGSSGKIPSLSLQQMLSEYIPVAGWELPGCIATATERNTIFPNTTSIVTLSKDIPTPPPKA